MAAFTSKIGATFALFMNKTQTAQTAIPVMEAFYTLQGEGAYSGQAAYFIRLGGCDVGCVWCDVKESWPAEAHPKMFPEQVVAEAAKYPARLAVVTGGEPLMYHLDELTQTLHEAGFQTNVETSGAYPLSGRWDWICLSPKKFKAPVESIYPYVNELKVIVYNKSDFAWAEEHAAKVGSACKLFLQPEWDKRDAMTPLIIDYVKQNPRWQISLQTHKYLDIP
jgi:organic radical activating enzyme